MASAWIERKARKGGGFSYRVRFTLGGRESVPRWAGAFGTKREAEARKQWVRDELAAMRVPDLNLVTPPATITISVLSEKWRTSRIDVSDGTRTTHSVNLSRILPFLGEAVAAEVKKGDVQELVAKLHSNGLKRETIRKTIATLAMVFDHGEIAPNPARGVKLPELRVDEVNPPTAAHVESVIRLLPSAYRLPALVLDATGMRVGELERLRWGDVDEGASRWRVSGSTAKTRRARWVPVPAEILARVVELVPREDRDLGAAVFVGFTADRLRTAITRACKATGVPAFSPHDLRHRRATLWHLSGVPAAEAAAWLGHSPQEHLRTYAHAALVDRRELDHARVVHRSVHTPGTKVHG